jgi:hypothetical protein
VSVHVRYKGAACLIVSNCGICWYDNTFETKESTSKIVNKEILCSCTKNVATTSEPTQE